MAKNAGQPEDIVKVRLRRFLREHFLYVEEVWGDGPYQRVRADFWAYPKEPLITAGWPLAPIVIETKGHELEDHRKRTAIHVIHQAIIYSLSRFPTKAGPARPNWVLIHPPLSAYLEADGSQTYQTFAGGLAYGLARLGAMFNVGELALTNDTWEVRLHGGTYYSPRRGFNGSNQLARGRDVASR